MIVVRNLRGVRWFWRQTRGEWALHQRVYVSMHLLVSGQWTARRIAPRKQR